MKTNLPYQKLENKIKDLESKLEKLTGNEEKYRLITENISDVVWVFNISKNKFTFISPSEYKITGYTAKESVQQGLRDKFTTESAKRAEETIRIETQKFIKNPTKNDIQVYNFQQKCKNGSLIWIETSTNFRYNSDNEIEIVGTTRNIENRKKAEQIKKESELRYKLLYDNAPLAYQSLDDKATLINVNSAWLKTLGYKREEVIGKYFGDFMLPESAELIKERFPTFKACGYIRDAVFKMVKKDGAVISVTYSGNISTDSDGNFLQTYCNFIDVTEQKKAEQALIKAKELVEVNNANITAIIEGTNNSIWAFDQNYDILYINQVFQKEFQNSFGVRLDRGVNLIEALPQELRPFWEPRYAKVLRNEQFIIEDAVDTLNGKIYIEITFNPIIKNSQVVGGTCLGSNITERKLIEQELDLHRYDLEKMVAARTAELISTNNDLSEAVRIFVGREQKIKQLEEEIETLKNET